MRGQGGANVPVSRRTFVTGTALAAATTAGCSDIRQQSFDARPVGLPAAERGPVGMAETSMESMTLTFDGPASTEVEVTNHSAVYRRAADDGGT